ncbi:DUF3519 domain-containing protein [Helicobacter pylori]|uniref:DUF3519 domain-containing protein n=1 Tax=Helicobacter pylori TaxID=210 RepID=UPI000952F706|nr:DUF3519 domain-containing protein [Helicobacter pylori]OLR44820.1 hypothetical protein BIZ44_01180 [Helicobacter pylori]OLR48992.1 hypothetical protein BIZ50_00540 [Helicobacter pylori]
MRLNDKWDNQKLENKWVISSYEIYNSKSELPFRPIAQLQGVGLGTPKLTESNPTTSTLKKQEPYKMVFIPTARKTLSFRSQDVGA